MENNAVIVERWTVTIGHSQKAKPHYVLMNENETLCGKYIPPYPEEWSLVPTANGIQWPLHRHVCKRCQKLLNRQVKAGRVVRLTKKGEGREDADESGENLTYLL